MRSLELNAYREPGCSGGEGDKGGGDGGGDGGGAGGEGGGDGWNCTTKDSVPE